MQRVILSLFCPILVAIIIRVILFLIAFILGWIGIFFNARKEYVDFLADIGAFDTFVWNDSWLFWGIVAIITFVAEMIIWSVNSDNVNVRNTVDDSRERNDFRLIKEPMTFNEVKPEQDNKDSMKCYSCGKIIPSESKFCPYCGYNLYITCPKCGHEYSSLHSVCNQCGTNKDYFFTLEKIKNMNPYEIPYGTVHIKPYQFQFESNNILYAIIPDTVTSIDDNAFRGCESLREIIIPNSVRLIGKRAFKDCKSLQIIHLPQIKSIEEETFMGCDSLTTIDIPSSVNSIGEYAFANCNSLIQIVIPNTVTSISSHAFDRCTSLASVIMPESFNNIGNWIFECCFNLNPSTKARLRNLEKKYNVNLFYD